MAWSPSFRARAEALRQKQSLAIIQEATVHVTPKQRLDAARKAVRAKAVQAVRAVIRWQTRNFFR